MKTLIAAAALSLIASAAHAESSSCTSDAMAWSRYDIVRAKTDEVLADQMDKKVEPGFVVRLHAKMYDAEARMKIAREQHKLDVECQAVDQLVADYESLGVHVDLP